MFFEKIASVARLSPLSSDSNKEQYAEITIYGAIEINIQPATPELTAIADGAYGQVFLGFVTASGIALGDRITVSGTADQYIVRGIANWNYAPIPHLELTLFKGDN